MEDSQGVRADFEKELTALFRKAVTNDPEASGVLADKIATQLKQSLAQLQNAVTAIPKPPTAEVIAAAVATCVTAGPTSGGGGQAQPQTDGGKALGKPPPRAGIFSSAELSRVSTSLAALGIAALIIATVLGGWAFLTIARAPNRPSEATATSAPSAEEDLSEVAWRTAINNLALEHTKLFMDNSGLLCGAERVVLPCQSFAAAEQALRALTPDQAGRLAPVEAAIRQRLKCSRQAAFAEPRETSSAAPPAVAIDPGKVADAIAGCLDEASEG